MNLFQFLETSDSSEEADEEMASLILGLLWFDLFHLILSN